MCYTTIGCGRRENNGQLRIEVMDEPRWWPWGGSGGGGGVGLDNRLNGKRRPMAAAVDDEALRMPPCFRGGSGKWAYCTGGPVKVSGSSSCRGESVELVVLVRIVLGVSEG